VALREPPADLASRFNTHMERATRLSEALLRAKPGDADAHYQVAATVGLQASYIATVEGRIVGAFRAARRAYDEGETALELDASRKDAGLVVGTYRYVVSLMSLPLRMMAYVAGFGGGKERGLQMVEEAAGFASEAQPDARFALVLLYNREGRYGDALRQIAELQRRYPRNRLLWLEAGATALRGGARRRPSPSSMPACGCLAPTSGSGCSAKKRCGTRNAARRASRCGGSTRPTRICGAP